jgi:hypothetical protein
VRKALVALIAVAILLIAYAVYRSHSDGLNIDPDAAREIEKAKRR